MTFKRAIRSLSAATLVALAGCGFLQPQPDQSRFFVLTPMSEPTDLAATPLSIGLGPIELPAYLRRTQMVTRIGENEITLSEVHRWGEPLDANFSRVLADNLSRQLHTNRVAAFPWFDATALDYAVRVSVLRFEADERGAVRLLARWLVADPTTDKTLHSDESDIRQEATDGSPDAAVSAMSAAVEKLATEIAQAVEEIKGP